MATNNKGLSMPTEDKLLLGGTVIAVAGLVAPGLDMTTRLEVLATGLGIMGVGKTLPSVGTSA